MDNRTREILREVMEKFTTVSYIAPDDVPEIPLYMDQITTFMETKLEACKRYPEDKILTKTMINNYTKNKLIPPPDKKKYSKEHLFLLIYVYYLKDFLSISDIKALLQPLEDSHFQSDEGLTMQAIYHEVFDLVKGQANYMARDLLRRWKAADKAFPETDGETAEDLHLFAFVCLLSFDVYVKKKMIETVVDAMNASGEKTDEKKNDKNDKKDSKDGAAAK